MRNECNTPDFCVCRFCHARYYTVELLQEGLDNAKDDNDLVHFIFNPIAKIATKKWLWRNELFEDGIAAAVEKILLYARTHVLQDTQECLKALFSEAHKGVNNVWNEWLRHEAPWVDPRELDDSEKAKTRLIGRRVYDSSRLGDEECTDLLTKIFDEDAARHPDAAENDTVKMTDARAVISAFFDPSNSLNNIKAGLEQAAWSLGILSKAKADLQESVSTQNFLRELFVEIFPLARVVGVPKENIVLCFQRAKQHLYGPHINQRKMLTRVYNRRRHLDHTIPL